MANLHVVLLKNQKQTEPETWKTIIYIHDFVWDNCLTIERIFINILVVI